MSKITSALFVDYDNVQTFFKQTKFSGRIANWCGWLEDGRFDPQRRRRDFKIKKVFWHEVYAEERPAFEQYGFKTQTCVYHAGSKSGQSAVDINLAMDVIEATNRLRSLREVVILASDSDYVPVIHRLKAKDIKTTIVFSERDASKVYKEIADVIITEEALAGAIDYVRPRRGLFVRQPEIALAPAAGEDDVNAIRLVVPAKRARQRRPRPPQQPFDMAVLAERLAIVAKSKPGSPLGRPEVLKVFRSFTGFVATGARAWFGYADYEGVLTAIQDHQPALRVIHYPNGGVAIEYPSAAARAEGGQSLGAP